MGEVKTFELKKGTLRDMLFFDDFSLTLGMGPCSNGQTQAIGVFSGKDQNRD